MNDLANGFSSDALNDSFREKCDAINNQTTLINNESQNNHLIQDNMDANFSIASSGQNNIASEIKDIKFGVNEGKEKYSPASSKNKVQR